MGLITKLEQRVETVLLRYQPTAVRAGGLETASKTRSLRYVFNLY